MSGSGRKTIEMTLLSSSGESGQQNFSKLQREQIRGAIRKKYMGVAHSAEGRFRYQTGREGAAALHYDNDILEAMPDTLLNSFCGVGNPFTLGVIKPGVAVLDVGCGAGFDLVVADHHTGGQGRVCGIDLTLEMVERARENLKFLGLGHIEICQISTEEIPYKDETFDVVISNGVINLSPAKGELFQEIFRVLQPGGRLQFADMVLDGQLPPGVTGSLEAWSQ